MVTKGRYRMIRYKNGPPNQWVLIVAVIVTQTNHPSRWHGITKRDKILWCPVSVIIASGVPFKNTSNNNSNSSYNSMEYPFQHRRSMATILQKYKPLYMRTPKYFYNLFDQAHPPKHNHWPMPPHDDVPLFIIHICGSFYTWRHKYIHISKFLQTQRPMM